MKIFNELQWRGLIKQTSSDKLESLLNESKVVFYCGFDPTADSLHIGSLLPLITMKRLQMAGHTPLALVGGATGFIGDPSFKANERAMLSEDQIRQNSVGIKKSILQVLKKVELVNNFDWIKNISLLDFLRFQGKSFSINSMINKESVKERISDPNKGISFTEFSYPILQAEDFKHLFETKNCILQIGGSDQLINALGGVDLIRRSFQKEAFVMTTPLLLKSDGTKFGKSESGNVWLDPNKTTPFEMFQFFVQLKETEMDIISLLKMLTFLSEDEIKELETSLKTEPQLRKAQKALAQEVVAIVHGREVLNEVLKRVESFFEKGDNSVVDLKLTKTSLQNKKVIDLLVELKLSPSKTMARKDIEGHAIKINDKKVSDPQEILNDHLNAEKLVVQKGKKLFKVIEII